ncbi:Asp-tRNA(Asn)/Glu-tRNA(Gln) amidotransferase subunit GatA [Ferruginibacter albus]|uniref:Asp-tRNA(Asn)/Glu-tRNA(Gln) amidotransferase subunit GatA n=1 Tax=Ferruginibacter albus TaxID=2875540 RepID=UPI001CC6577E|nr:Asp-tRNA(Asn)/Glu-tRNA(Gln) amidotransferase subunit GatA [Ferruginibacter albus]UAY52401.1 Asp-tRNA(Asn)/Glu-tRNA(Gln) amidotransferase subunit GatA [Ferruginibacter albus]
MFLFNSIDEYHQQLIQGNTSCEAVITHYLQQIDKHKELNAFVNIYKEEALKRAAALDEKRKQREPLKKLHGVVVAIKDVICHKDHEVTASSNILKGFKSIYNATSVQKLLDEDAIIIGSCNCDEFAMGSSNENSSYGPVLNAFDTTKVPGGSSGGSAVAVQAGMCMVSLGSDTGGSVRQPADFCGIVGIKPTYGRISRYGLIAYASSFDQIGVFGNTIEDVEKTLEVISGPDDFDSTAIQQGSLNFSSSNNKEKKYRIAYFKEAIEHESLDKEISNGINKTLEQLKNNGNTVQAVEFDLLDYVVPAYYVLTTAEASSNLSRFDGVRYGHRTKEAVTDLVDFYKRTRSEGFGKEVQKRILLGTFVLSAGYYDAYYSKAQKVRRLLTDKIAAIFKEYDAIVLPTSPTTAFKLGEKTDDPIAMYLADIYTVFANLTGVPAISVPLYKHSNGMPFGLQVITNKQDELTLLEFSKVLMQHYKSYQHLATNE